MAIIPFSFPETEEDEFYFVEDILLETARLLDCTPKQLMQKIYFLLQDK